MYTCMCVYISLSLYIYIYMYIKGHAPPLAPAREGPAATPPRHSPRASEYAVFNSTIDILTNLDLRSKFYQTSSKLSSIEKTPRD